MNQHELKLMIEAGDTSLGIELGSTRIKAVLIGANCKPLASSFHEWENQLDNGIWTYPMSAVWAGLQDVYQKLADTVRAEYGVCLRKIGSIGISAMMHGYLPFNAEGEQLAPFRTWRNTMTEKASKELTKRFRFNIPQRWSIAHLYHAMLEKEPHVEEIAFLTTLAGYVHWKLTGEKILGVGEASGMFPIDSTSNDFSGDMIDCFDGMAQKLGIHWKLRDILPKVCSAGESAGHLTEEGARLLDPSGRLESEIPCCPPEGDAGTGMVATNAVAQRTGNVSAGTSIFAMIVLEKPLAKVYEEIDMVTTPTGKPVGMVHCNNCTSDFDAWVRLFGQVLTAMGFSFQKSALYDAIYAEALKGEPDGGGLLSYNYYSGEPITGFEEGRPLLVRTPNSAFSLANLAKTLLYSTMATLRIGMNILTVEEAVAVDVLQGHGGLFKTPAVGQSLMAGALNIPISVMETAGEGGAWGIALLADYMRRKQKEETLEEYLSAHVFSQAACVTAAPKKSDIDGFADYLTRYKDGLAIERAAVTHLK
ncbi:FGGY-family carbohydrate kinase [Oscillospiraceae bacterium MB08-C2-2]|nr:FGGY-family carbohydrate kinase [Oscillospiraceae bacterium MB08-C2-2]